MVIMRRGRAGTTHILSTVPLAPEGGWSMPRSFVVGLLVVISDGLFLGQLSGAEPRTQRPGPVCLAVREVNPLESPPQAGGLLVREIVRQAFLIAARDECGLSTRDQTLRESLDLPAHANSTPFATLVATPITEGSDTCHVRVSVTHGNGKAGNPLWETTVDISRYVLIPVLVDKAEAWSRKEFKIVLAQSRPDGQGSRGPLLGRDSRIGRNAPLGMERDRRLHGAPPNPR